MKAVQRPGLRGPLSRALSRYVYVLPSATLRGANMRFCYFHLFLLDAITGTHRAARGASRDCEKKQLFSTFPSRGASGARVPRID